MDADFTVETVKMNRMQILQQAGNALVLQANTSPPHLYRCTIRFWINRHM